MQDGLRRALASTSWPANLNPSPDEWQTTADQRKAMSACTATDADDPDSCTFGNRKGPEIIVFGDSIGFPLLATVEKAYGAEFKVRGMTKIACAVNGVDADFGKDEWAVPCVNHRQMVLDYVRRVKPQVLIMTETYSWAVRLKSGAKGSASAREWLAADQAFVDAVQASVGSVVIVAPSMPGVAFLDCYRPGGSPRRCVTGIPAWWARTRDVEKKVTRCDLHRHDALVLRRRALPDLHAHDRHGAQGRLPAHLGAVRASARARLRLPHEGVGGAAVKAADGTSRSSPTRARMRRSATASGARPSGSRGASPATGRVASPVSVWGGRTSSTRMRRRRSSVARAASRP